MELKWAFTLRTLYNAVERDSAAHIFSPNDRSFSCHLFRLLSQIRVIQPNSKEILQFQQLLNLELISASIHTYYFPSFSGTFVRVFYEIYRKTFTEFHRSMRFGTQIKQLYILVQFIKLAPIFGATTRSLYKWFNFTALVDGTTNLWTNGIFRT